jgi:hypothetical protein
MNKKAITTDEEVGVSDLCVLVLSMLAALDMTLAFYF